MSYLVYYEKAGGKPVKMRAATKRRAVVLACEASRKTGGYVTVNRKGVEVAACFDGRVAKKGR